MGMYSFQKQFVPLVESGEKTHTIRAERRYPDKPGNMLHLYYAARTKQCRLLGRFLCTKVQEIVIDDTLGIIVDGDVLSRDERESLAVRDGFRNYTDMMAFWKDRTPFVGHIIHWKYPASEK